MPSRFIFSCVLTLLLYAHVALGAMATTGKELGAISILAADNLITSDIANTTGAILLSRPTSLASAEASCSALYESLLSPSSQDFKSGLNSSLAYEVYSGRYPSDQLFWIKQSGSDLSARWECDALSVTGKVKQVSCSEWLPALCTQSAPASNITFANTTTPYQVAQHVGNQTLVGYRDFLTFRFLGVRFAAEPERFTYSTVYSGTGTNYALTGAPECLQPPNNGSTDCLFANIWTTYLPAAETSKKDLKPVMVYIYGGGFTTGSASNPTNDGGNTAARGDVVAVDLAYRLSTLGFLAFEDGVHNGNYWISDVISGLQWVQKNIAAFGGDPSKVTIYGESAGAETVQALLASPKANGLFRGAIMQSNYYQPYQPIPQAYNHTTLPILNLTGCGNGTTADQLACLRAYNATALINLPTLFNYPVIDGTYLTSAYINLNKTVNGGTSSVPVLMGVNRDEGGVLSTVYPTSNLTTGVYDLAASDGTNAAAILASGLFPLGSSTGFGNNATLDVFNTTVRIYTDDSFKCSNYFLAYAAATTGVWPSVYFYEFNRTYQDPGYNSNGVCLPAATATHPNGDPSLEYFKCHAGDLANTFGNVARVGFPFRDENDAPYQQLVLDYWTAFGRSLDPNPDKGYLEARGYWDTLNQIALSGQWEPVDAANPMMLELQWNSFMIEFGEKAQCSLLGTPFDLLV